MRHASVLVSMAIAVLAIPFIFLDLRTTQYAADIQTHLACLSPNTCGLAPGAGPDECATNADCAPGMPGSNAEPTLTILLSGVDASQALSAGKKDVVLFDFTAVSTTATTLRALRFHIAGMPPDSLGSGFIASNVRLAMQQGRDWVVVGAEDNQRGHADGGAIIAVGPMAATIEARTPVRFRLIGDIGDQVGKNFVVRFPEGDPAHRGSFIVADGMAGIRVDNGDCVDARGEVAPPEACAIRVFGPSPLRPYGASNDLSITATGPEGGAMAETPFTYTIVVTNNGGAEAQNVELGTTSEYFFPSAGNFQWISFEGATCEKQQGSGFSCSVPLLAGGASATVRATAGLSRHTASCVPGTFTITFGAKADGPDANMGDNTVETPVELNCALADLGLMVEAPQTVRPGAALTYVFRLMNAGPSDEEEATMVAQIPKDSFVADLSDDRCEDSLNSDGASTSVRCRVPLAAGAEAATVNVTFTVPVDAACDSLIEGTGDISSVTGDPNPENNEVLPTTTVKCASGDLWVQARDTEPAKWQEGIPVTIGLGNLGPDAATDTTLTVVPDLAGPYEFFDLSNDKCGVADVGGKKAIVCSHFSLTANQAGALTFTIVPSEGAVCRPQTVVSTTATISGNVTDPQPSNNTASARTPVVCFAAAITQPANNAYVQGIIDVKETVTGSQPSGLSARLFADANYNRAFATATLQPSGGEASFILRLDTKLLADGLRTLYVRIYDASGQVIDQKTVAVMVMNTPPSVVFSPPISAGTVIAGTATIGVQAGNPGATATTPFSKQELLVDGAVIATLTAGAPPFSFAFDSTTVSDGNHTLEARVYNAAGVMGKTAPRTIVVRNTQTNLAASCTLLNADTFVTKVLYGDILGRAPDAGGLQFWVSAMNAGLTRSAAVDQFFKVKEFTDPAFLTRAYRLHAQHPGPTPSQLQDWADRMRAKTGDQMGMIAAVLPLPGGPSFGNRTNNQFVTSLYQNVLKRQPDTGGLNYWIGQLQRGVSRTAVARQFLVVGAANALYDKSDWVRNAHLTLLRRTATTDDEAAGLAQLNRAGATTTSAAGWFLNTPDFLSRYQCDGTPL